MNSPTTNVTVITRSLAAPGDRRMDLQIPQKLHPHKLSLFDLCDSFLEKPHSKTYLPLFDQI